MHHYFLSSLYSSRRLFALAAASWPCHAWHWLHWLHWLLAEITRSQGGKVIRVKWMGPVSLRMQEIV